MWTLTNSAKLIEKIWGLNVTKIWPSAPSNPIEWNLWYDTTNDVLKSYDWTNWNEIGSWWGSEIVYISQDDYDALPSSKLTDGKNYVIKTCS